MKNTDPSTPKRNRRSPVQRSKPSSGDRLNPTLDEEIERLTGMAARVDDMFTEDRSLTDMLRALDVLGKNATRILTLLKAQKELGGDHEAMDALHLAMTEMIEEMEKKQHPS